jgi:hypothetical protein
MQNVFLVVLCQYSWISFFFILFEIKEIRRLVLMNQWLLSSRTCSSDLIPIIIFFLCWFQY